MEEKGSLQLGKGETWLRRPCRGMTLYPWRRGQSRPSKGRKRGSPPPIGKKKVRPRKPFFQKRRLGRGKGGKRALPKRRTENALSAERGKDQRRRPRGGGRKGPLAALGKKKNPAKKTGNYPRNQKKQDPGGKKKGGGKITSPSLGERVQQEKTRRAWGGGGGRLLIKKGKRKGTSVSRH